MNVKPIAPLRFSEVPGWLLAALLAILSWNSIGYSQVISGSIEGTITDQSGAIVPRTALVAKQVDTGLTYTAESNDAGLYVFPDLRPGPYDISVSASGFSNVVRKNISVRVGDRLRIDYALQVGGQAQFVDVAAQSPLVQSDNTAVGKVIDEVNMKELPLADRNAFGLVLLTPGTQQRNGDAQPRLGGGRQRNNEFSLDGVTVTDPRRGDTTYTPNLDALQEFKVVTNGISAEYGRLVGGLVSATLKSGTNGFHGNLFEYVRSDIFNARNFFSPAVPKLDYNQFGGMLGGPIRKNKIFFFMDYQGTRTRQGTVFNLTVPAPAYLRGDFSGLLGTSVGQDAQGRSVLQNQIFDPATTRIVNGKQVRDPFPGNIIPASRFDPAVAKLSSLWPSPNVPGALQAFQTLAPYGDNDDKFDTRVDEQLTGRDLIFGRFSRDADNSIAARPFAAAQTGGNNGQFSTYITGALNWTRTITPTTLNEARASVLRYVYDRLLTDTSTQGLGIPNLSPHNLPVFLVSGYAGLGDSPAFQPAQTSYQFLDSMTFVRGRHIVKVGADYRRFQINDLQGFANGQYTFNKNETGAPGFGTTGNPIASFLLGAVDAFSNSPQAATARFYERSYYFAGFVQDDFKMLPSFTLNLGVRYEMEQPTTDLRSSGSNFNLVRGVVETMKQLGTNQLQNTVHGFAPRLGFAWQPKGGKTVVRSSFGMFYIPLTGMATSAFDHFPTTQTITQNSDGVNPLFYVSQTPPVTGTSDGKGLTHFYVQKNAPYGYFMQWNFDIQHQIPGSILLQATYAGSVGRHLLETNQLNEIPIQVVQAAGKSSQSLRPYPDYANIQAWLPRQNSSYHALELSAERRWSKGLTFLLSYTYSKYIDEQEDFFGGDFAMYDYNLRLEKGLSVANIPQRFSASSIWEMPFGAGKRWLNSGFPGAVAANWSLSTIVTLQSGQQVQISQSNNTSGTFSSAFRPNLIENPILPGDQRTLTRWFNTAAFQAPPAFTLGTSSKTPGIQGPGLANVDLALHRSVMLPWREGMKIELRGECFNCFNRSNFLIPSGVFGTPTFGQVTAAGPARTLQVAMKLRF